MQQVVLIFLVPFTLVKCYGTQLGALSVSIRLGL